MPKNIVICCDGTNNQFSGEHTNVIRTYKAAVRAADQVTFYDCGVGTMPEPWQATVPGKKWSILKGLAMGAGFEQNIEDAYRFLMANYQTGDHVFLFGFSRGAFTVRALAGMLHAVGLLHPGTENLIPYAIRYWLGDYFDPHGAGEDGQALCREFKSTLARECPVHFIGVWDTVGSVGIINKYRTFPHTMKNPSVTNVRHAVAIDERRCCFRQNLMFKVHDRQDIKNVWFAGVHSDVGGGYPAREAELAKLTFQWMLREARHFGLLVDDAKYQHQLNLKTGPCATAEQHDSLSAGWRVVEFIPMRRYNWEKGGKEWRWSFGIPKPRDLRRHAGNPAVWLHTSVIERLQKCASYRPPNLPHSEAELRTLFNNRIET